MTYRVGNHRLASLVLGSYLSVLNSLSATAEEAPNYDTQIAPILTKYCAGCHNSEDVEGELALDSFAGLTKGGETGAVLAAGNSKSSRLIGVLTGQVEPQMPPEGEEAPTKEEIALLAAWIDSGAKGPTGSAAHERRLVTPKHPPVDAPPAVTSLAFSPDGKSLAIARFGQVELRRLDDDPVEPVVLEHPGKVQSVRFAPDGQTLLTSTGVTGLFGESRSWNVAEGTLLRTYPAEGDAGHSDIVYASVATPDGTLVATAGYDRKISLWNAETSELVRTLEGHNGAVFDLAFSPDGSLLSSASADSTVKVWHVATGTRFDTRSEPLKEQYTTAISPDGQIFVGAGEDSRIRVWELVSIEKPQINPLLITRFAHEGSIHLLRFSEDGSLLVSAGMDGTVKLWETDGFRQINSWPDQIASVQAVAISSAASQVAVGRMDGSVEFYPLPDSANTESQITAHSNTSPPPAVTGLTSQASEAEPNNSVSEAGPVAAPARIRGVIHAERGDKNTDVDLFRFSSLANQTWIIEVRAARDESPLDSHIEVLNATGQPIPRVVLQATYDSYFEFRGKDSSQDQDFRLFNWREMRLNEYLYCNGEVVKFYSYPRGPDSGFRVYSNSGKRHGYFDTTPITHALNEPCYVVEPRSPGEPIVPNGLPTFVINYENDDDSLRRFGNDSFLTFTAPEDGEYLVRVSDVRGLQGAEYKYELAIRAPQPDFKIAAVKQDTTEFVPGAGHKFSVFVDRIDGFDEPVKVHIEDLPPGFSTHSPLTVPSGQAQARGAIYAAADAVAPAEEESNVIRLVAAAEIEGREVRKWPFEFGKFTLKEENTLNVVLEPNQTDYPVKADLPVLEITPGTTTTFLIRVERSGHEERVSFGKEDAAHNAPHGVYVNNIGLNGLQIQAGESERVAFLTAEPWVEPQERVIFVEASEAGRPTSNPMLLRVVRPDARLTSR